MAGDSRDLIANVHTRMGLLEVENWRFPVSINDANIAGNSYVVSPQSAYGVYALEELQRLDRPWLAWPLSLLIRTLSILLNSASLDRLLQVNNWLLSTNLYPDDWQGERLTELTRMLTSQYPNHAICFRSLNTRLNGPLLAAMQAAGYILLPSRQLYVFDGRAGSNSVYLRKRATKIDLRLQAKSLWRMRTVSRPTPREAEQAADMYHQLYLQKYCRLNPCYKAEWITRCSNAGIINLHFLEQAPGMPDGVLAWFAPNQVMSSPIVGYRLTMPAKYGLYRLLAVYSLYQASLQKRWLNFSSGAAHFKRLRGGEPAIEYSAVYVAHLSRPRRMVWRSLARLLHLVAVPLMKRMKL
jgi:hypothetical protein